MVIALCFIIYVRTCICTCIYLHMNIYMYTCIYIYKCTYAYIHRYICVYAVICAHTYRCCSTLQSLLDESPAEIPFAFCYSYAWCSPPKHYAYIRFGLCSQRVQVLTDHRRRPQSIREGTHLRRLHGLEDLRDDLMKTPILQMG